MWASGSTSLHSPQDLSPAGLWPSQTLFLMQRFALGPPLLWLPLTLTAPTWGPQAPFLETLPLAPYWGPSTCICTETQLFWASAGPCILPVSQRKRHWRQMPSWAVSHL